LFDRRHRYFILFLQNLKLKKSKNLFNRNLIKNYFFLKFLLNFFKKRKSSFLLKSFFFINRKSLYVNPVFTLNKQLFNFKSEYNDFIIKSECESFFLNKKYLSKFKNPTQYYNFTKLWGLNYFIIPEKNHFFLLDEFFKNNDNKILNKKFFKFFNYSSVDFNYFINYNIFFINLLEFYKILILLTFVKIIN
jgi:hypothetical protein